MGAAEPGVVGRVCACAVSWIFPRFFKGKGKKKHESFPNIETLQYLQDESNLFGWLVGYG
jgi:hypothetical protein